MVSRAPNPAYLEANSAFLTGRIKIPAMPTLFGTDGVRGVANLELSSELVLALGRAAGAWLKTRASRPKVIIGRDTRQSGDLLQSALIAGLLSSGTDAVPTGILPSPAVAFLTLDEHAEAGAVISASHNPPGDNGIKFFGADGFKLTEQDEEAIENLVDAAIDLPSSGEVGRVGGIDGAVDRYIAHAVRSLEGRRLGGLKIVADCANGAAHEVAPRALRDAGAEVIAVNANPDGENINVRCGSTSPEMAAKAVIEHGADAGLAFDGDADRVLAIDDQGNVVDGDAMLAALAIDQKEQGELPHNRVVVTVMANLGLRRAFQDAGIEMVETPVGDRFVAEAMRREGIVLGGEQSGHLIFARHSTTGDGLITGLKLLALTVSSGRRLSEIASVVQRYPQVLVNVRVPDSRRLDQARRVWEEVRSVSDELGEAGRVLVRPSGTEPLIRVMVEASEQAIAEESARRIVAVVEDEMGGGVKS
jgi:phosphoglucosamine mutase